ncbi:signal peptidase II [Lacrimispora sp. NSJ-141]|uniref:Signal peptidase II n=1 Tax=Lientehia hominis TaxID=2897778 RepID=A0AAP2RIQ4_9FIRM|nr:signal peptidase II [Lientehia hominis]MCD2492123.1 signal peptidase II [Lientehia hominis]
MVYLILAAFIFGLDLFLKNRIEARQDDAFPVRLDNGISLEKHHNRGFLLNKLEDKPELVKKISVLTLIPLFLWFLWLFVKKAGSLGKIGASFLLGGAASNLYDRLFRGYVVDYIRLPIKKIRHIIFNIADFFLFLGAALSAVYGLFSK